MLIIMAYRLEDAANGYKRVKGFKWSSYWVEFLENDPELLKEEGLDKAFDPVKNEIVSDSACQ
jgi:hypothetical protein